MGQSIRWCLPYPPTKLDRSQDSKLGQAVEQSDRELGQPIVLLAHVPVNIG